MARNLCYTRSNALLIFLLVMKNKIEVTSHSYKHKHLTQEIHAPWSATCLSGFKDSIDLKFCSIAFILYLNINHDYLCSVKLKHNLHLFFVIPRSKSIWASMSSTSKCFFTSPEYQEPFSRTTIKTIKSEKNVQKWTSDSKIHTSLCQMIKLQNKQKNCMRIDVKLCLTWCRRDEMDGVVKERNNIMWYGMNL